jgi:hypothetical protein
LPRPVRGFKPQTGKKLKEKRPVHRYDCKIGREYLWAIWQGKLRWYSAQAVWLAVWICGLFGITAALGVKIAPQLSATWLYPRIVWGGIWGLLFLLPLMKRNILTRGLIFSLGPTLVQLFVIFPLKANKGMMGLDLGALTPVAVVVFNAIWGVTAAVWLRLTNKQA